MSTAVLLLVFGTLVLFSVLFSRPLTRIGVPVVLLFLVLGMIGGSEGFGGVSFEDYGLAFRLGTVALVLILFDGGLNTASASIRQSLLPAGLLATVGVAGTAGVMALGARMFGLSWGESLLIGAVVSSTDAAAVFAVLRGGNVNVKEPVRSTLEVESCINDPMAVILTVTIVEILRDGGSVEWRDLAMLPVQLLVGATVGCAIGFAGRHVLERVRFGTAGLYPVATLSLAFLAFGLATLLMGSGFLAVFAAGCVLGNGQLPYKAGLTRVHDAIAWFAQVSMFLMLGLLSFPSRLVDVAGVGLALGLVLAIVARPVVVMLCLLPLRWKKNPVVYVSWVGIRGAVPIILATIPIMAGLQNSERVFDVVFFVVVVSVLVPGASILPITRWLGLEARGRPSPSTLLEMNTLRRTDGEIFVYRVDQTTAVCGARLADIPFPEHASVLLVVRGDELLPARGATILLEADFAYVFCRSEDEPAIGLLFGSSVAR